MQLDLQFVSPEASALYGGKLAPAHERDAGVDLRATIAATIHSGQRLMVPAGIKVGMPPMIGVGGIPGLEIEAQVRPRSGLFAKHGVSVGNTPGTVDAGYTGEVCVLLENRGHETFIIKPGDRIAQLVVCPVFRCSFRVVEELGATERGENGFGSTGQH